MAEDGGTDALVLVEVGRKRRWSRLRYRLSWRRRRCWRLGKGGDGGGVVAEVVAEVVEEGDGVVVLFWN